MSNSTNILVTGLYDKLLRGLLPAKVTCPREDVMGKVRVLIVDDNEVIRLLISSFFAATKDFELVGEAADGEAAVEMVRGLIPDLVIMDINMPKMNGIEATEQIHSEFPELNIIGLSTFDREDVGQAMLDAGATDCLSKTLPWEVVLSTIRQSINHTWLQ